MMSRSALGFAALFASLALPLPLTAQEQPALPVIEEAEPPKAAPAKPAPPRRPSSAPT